MPQIEAFEKLIFRGDQKQASVSFLLQGSSKFDSVGDRTSYRALERRRLSCVDVLLRTSIHARR